MIRFVQIVLLLVIGFAGVATSGCVTEPRLRTADVLGSALDRFTECAISAFVEHELDRRDADPERAFARCATEEDRVLGVTSLLKTEADRRLGYALWVRRKSELKDSMNAMKRRGQP